eukprot:1162024-Pelagomonas_calceolata.AAC.6
MSSPFNTHRQVARELPCNTQLVAFLVSMLGKDKDWRQVPHAGQQPAEWQQQQDLLQGRLGRLYIDANLGGGGPQQDMAFEAEVLVEAHAAGAAHVLVHDLSLMHAVRLPHIDANFVGEGLQQDITFELEALVEAHAAGELNVLEVCRGLWAHMFALCSSWPTSSEVLLKARMAVRACVLKLCMNFWARVSFCAILLTCTKESDVVYVCQSTHPSRFNFTLLLHDGLMTDMSEESECV